MVLWINKAQQCDPSLCFTANFALFYVAPSSRLFVRKLPCDKLYNYFAASFLSYINRKQEELGVPFCSRLPYSDYGFAIRLPIQDRYLIHAHPMLLKDIGGAPKTCSR